MNTGSEVTSLTAEQARALTDEIRSRVSDLLPLIKQAYEQRADRALGYTTWADYCSTELSGMRVPLGDRPAMVAELRQSGMSTRAIGSALGMSHQTVQRDLATGPDGPVEPERVVSLDGRERPAAMPARQEIADAILGQIDDYVAAPVEDDARRDAELDELMSETDVRFRRNFAEAKVRARQLITFDSGRINDIYTGNWDRDVGDLLNALDQWINQIRDDHRARQRAGLRLVSGGQQ